MIYSNFEISSNPQEITKRNVIKDCCSHSYCNEMSTHFVEIKINGMPLHIPLCSKHAKEIVAVSKIIGGN